VGGTYSKSAQVGQFYRLYLLARNTKKTPSEGLKTKLYRKKS